ncbi:MAG: hypothetical protein L0Z50_36455, partial [Verrucomicrobiales bacterium]|nr:hypothetical protein [Verrucomicrobiales bacterium]
AAPRILYDSRLIGLLSHPEGIFTTAAHALDYQFGFKVSETWVYRYLEKAFAWLLLLQLGALVLSTCFVFVRPGEQGLLERWGRPVAARGLLNPGLHLKFPFPMDRVFRNQTDRIQEFRVGASHDEKDEDGDEHGHAAATQERPRTILWTVPHEKEPFNLLVASRQPPSAFATNTPKSEQSAPVDLLTVDIPVQYQISDLRAWMYNYTGASNLLENIATREIVYYLVSVDMMKLLSVERERAATELRKRIQDRADQLKLGVKVLLVGLQDIHPPFGKGRTEVAKKYEEVVGARQQVEARLREAEGYAATNRAFSAAEAERRVHQAEAYKVRRMAAAAASAGQFTNQMLAFNASPRVFMERTYLQAFARGSTNARKYVITTTNNAQDVIQFNLEDKYDPLRDERIIAPTRK